MAGAEEVLRRTAARATAPTYASLVLNRKGLDRARSAARARSTRLPGHRHVRAAQPEHDRRGGRGRRGGDDRRGYADLKVDRDDRRRVRLPVRGPRRSRLVIEHARRMAAAGADEVILADTIGVGVPRQVRGWCRAR